MPIRLRQFAILLPVAMLAAGCGQFDQRTHADGRGGIATPLSFINKNFEQVDLLATLTQGSTNSSAITNDSLASWELQKAYKKFYEDSRARANGPNRRNEIQDELFRASDQRCSYYKAYLYHLQRTERSFFGGLSTALGGLGAIFTSASTARALSGAAGITSGVGAEIMEAQFASLTIQVLIDGIEKARKDAYEAARSQRFRNTPTAGVTRLATLEEYTVEHAILDAVRYHGACVITEGLRAAGSSIQTIRHPGPEMMRYALTQSQALKKQLDDGKPSEEAWSVGLAGVGGFAGATLGGGTASAISATPDIDLYTRRLQFEGRLAAYETSLQGLAAAAKDASLPKDETTKEVQTAADDAATKLADARVQMKSRFDTYLAGEKVGEVQQNVDWFTVQFRNLNNQIVIAASEGKSESLRDRRADLLAMIGKFATSIGAKFENYEDGIGEKLDALGKAIEDAGRIDRRTKLADLVKALKAVADAAADLANFKKPDGKRVDAGAAVQIPPAPGAAVPAVPVVREQLPPPATAPPPRAQQPPSR